MALGNGVRNAVAVYPSCGNSGRQYLAPRGAQPLVDHIGLHPFPKLNRSLGVCIHAMAESRQLEAPSLAGRHVRFASTATCPSLTSSVRRLDRLLARTSFSQRGGSPNTLRITLSASASKHRPWLSKIRCGCHEWIFLIAASVFCRWKSSGSRIPKKI